MEPLEVQGGQYGYFRELWEYPQPAPILSCPAMWDARADEWFQLLESDAAYLAKQMERVEATTAFLRQNGLLGPGSEALDIGCGPGLFTLAFAQTAGRVLGLDISPRMVQHAQSYAKKHGVSNAAFLALDFKQADVETLGWLKKFDLAMSCLTPAVTGVADLHKLMSVSRGHCLHVSFIHSSDSLRERMAAELYGRPRQEAGHWDGRVFFAVFNLLFLEGYNPRTFFFKQEADADLTLDESLARRYAGHMKKEGPELEEEAARIYDYLSGLCQREGRLHRSSEECYGFLLWDINEKRPARAGY